MSSDRPSAALHRKLAEVVGAVEALPKASVNKQQGYKYTSVEAIKEAVRKELASRHVMVYPSVLEVIRTEAGKTRNGAPITNTIVKGEVTFVDGDADPAEPGAMFTVPAAGEGQDSADKSLSKAQAMMLKYALIGVFLIPMEESDDPDAETVTNEPRGGQRSERPPKPLDLGKMKAEDVTPATFMQLAEQRGWTPEQIKDAARRLYGEDTPSSLGSLTAEQRHDLAMMLATEAEAARQASRSRSEGDYGDYGN